MRLPLIWLWRLLLGGFAIVYLASATLQLWLPPLVPFLAAAAVEAQFFVSGLRSGRATYAAAADRGPQARDLAELGWAGRTVSVTRGDAELVLRPGEMSAEEIDEWLRSHDDDLGVLGPGRHELAAISGPESPVELYVPPPPPRRVAQVRRRLLQVAIVLAVFAGVLLLVRSTPSWQKLAPSTRAATLAALDREATRIAGHPAKTICDVSGRHVGYVQDADGLAEVGGHRLWLTPEICYRLSTIRQTHRSSGPSSGHAIAVLAHEAWHLQGVTSEAVANCYAYQSGVGIGRALGLGANTSRQLMHEQLADNPADFASAPAYVVPSGCRHGGSLDLGLDGGRFP
ncbi:MAG: hypothetical protein ACJ77E_07480 [Gaiellaceae bacterium]